ncbi:AlpA family phage regulatory protein [Burkholderia stagnalis]|uniref:helix-turn-helix transcriptional regulator n=1 Tax=Burkholderia stagnalis TaxID=1503054 RepID=UPI000F5A09FC|nr:AlpA family phage regulatory protein [Burkholderia stagnalis]RQQ05439.1 AlpA family phage regulatory protein [Burkholderia stagnalis]
MSTPSDSIQALRPERAAKKLDCSIRKLWYFVAKDPTFPRPKKLSPRCTVFIEAELDNWIASRPN